MSRAVPRKVVEQLEAELARVRVLASGIAPEILDAVLEHGAQGIVVAATGGRITLHNRAAAALWPAAVADPTRNAPLMRCLETGTAVPPSEVAIERDGKPALLLETCAPMAGGRAVAMFTDITELARLHETSRAAQRRFEILARASRRFAENEPQHEALVEGIVAEVAAGLHAGALLALGDAQETIATVTDGDPSPAFGDREREVMRSGTSLVDRHAICAPLRARGRVIGALTAQREQPFAPDDLLLLEELAIQAALALDNAAQLRT
jgi:GAF domain-containing protein